MAIYRERSCTVCGSVYKPTSPNQKTCRGEGCILEITRRADRRRYKRNQKHYKRSCLDCGTGFETTDSRRKYCGSKECSEARLQRQRGRTEERRRGTRVEEKKDYYEDNKEYISDRKKKHYREVLHPDREVKEGNNIAILTYDFVKEYIEDCGYKLIDKVYINNHTKMDILCRNGHVWSTNFHNLKDNKNECPICVAGSISKISQRWLDVFDIPQDYREYRLDGVGGKRGFIVDGFDPKTNTVYEFLGDFWHGNPEVFDQDDINGVNKKSFGKLYKKTMNRIKLLRKNGYKVVYIWEKDFKEQE